MVSLPSSAAPFAAYLFLLGASAPHHAEAQPSSSCDDYSHFTVGRRADCDSDAYCTTHTIPQFLKVRQSLIKSSSTQDAYGTWWEDTIGANGAVSNGYCRKPANPTPEATTLTSSGVTAVYYNDVCGGTYDLESNSVPNHDIENYCSAAGGNLPPLMGTDDSGFFKTYSFTMTPSNEYIMETNNFVGMAVNGVTIYSPYTGIGTVAALDETLDKCNGHPSNGLYHYHGFSPCVHDEEVPATDPVHSAIYGWAYDGFPIYGPYGYDDPTDISSEVVLIKTGYVMDSTTDGTCPGDWSYDDGNTGHLDECNGRFTITDEFPDGIYAYYMNVDDDGNPEFPAVPYCFQSSASTTYISGDTPSCSEETA